MAEKRASLILQLKDKASSGIKRINERIKSFRVGMGTATLAIGGLVAALGASVKAFIQQENAVAKLNQSLKTQGVFTEAASKEIQDYAAELQKVTTVGDEVIIEQQALLTSFGATGEVLKGATKAALDLSAGLGIDLKAATLLVGKAVAGDTSTLSRYGIKIAEGTKESEKFAAVLEQVNSKFGGAAEARLNTFSGQVENLSNRFGDLSEKVGKAVIPALNNLLKAAEFVVTAMEALDKSVAGITEKEGNALRGRELTIASLEKQRDALIQVRSQNGELTTQEQRRLELINESIGREGQLLMAEKNASQQRIDAKVLENQTKAEIDTVAEEAKLKKKEEEKEATIAETDEFVLTLQDREAKRKGIEDSAEKRRVKQLAGRLKAHGDATKAEMLLEKFAADQKIKQEIKLNEQNKLLQQQRFAVAMDTLNRLSSLQNSKNKEAAAAGKAAAIVLATIDTFRAATAAMAALSGIPIVGPALGIAAAAAIVSAGLANVARISGTTLAQGGLVLPRPGGVQATIGEGGKSEAVIPLDDERTKEALGDTALGGITININPGVFIGNEENLRDLAKALDDKFFDLITNQESNAFRNLT